MFLSHDLHAWLKVLWILRKGVWLTMLLQTLLKSRSPLVQQCSNSVTTKMAGSEAKEWPCTVCYSGNSLLLCYEQNKAPIHSFLSDAPTAHSVGRWALPLYVYPKNLTNVMAGGPMLIICCCRIVQCTRHSYMFASVMLIAKLMVPITHFFVQHK